MHAVFSQFFLWIPVFVCFQPQSISGLILLWKKEKKKEREKHPSATDCKEPTPEATRSSLAPSHHSHPSHGPPPRSTLSLWAWPSHPIHADQSTASMPSIPSPFSGFYAAAAHGQLLSTGFGLTVAASSRTEPRSSSPSARSAKRHPTAQIAP
jgi:hypothetical protein